MEWKTALKIFIPTILVLSVSASADSDISSSVVVNPFLSLAAESAHAKDWAKAEQLYLRATKDPDAHDAAVIGLAHVYAAENRVGDAKTALSDLVTHDSPFDVNARLTYADLLRATGDFNSAEKQLASIEVLRPGSHLSWRERGLLYFDMKRMDEAVKYLDEVLQTDPNDPLARFRRAQAFMDLSKPRDAIRDLSILVEARPSEVDYRNALGDAYVQASEYPKAAETFEYSVKLNPANPLTYEKLADSDLKLERLDQAAESYRKCIELDPYRQPVGDKLAKLYIRLNQLDKAQAEYRREVQVNPNLDGPAEEYVALLVRQKKIDQEGEFLQAYVAHFPGKSWADTRYAKLLLSIGNLDRAESVAKTAMDKTGSMDSMLLYAYIRDSRGDVSEAASVLASAEKQYPGQPIVQFNRALALEALGKYDQAVAEYRNVPVSSNYGHKALVNLALLLEKMGRPKESLQALEQIKEADVEAGVPVKIAQLESELSARKPTSIQAPGVSKGAR